jgi:hypothetical protein
MGSSRKLVPFYSGSLERNLCLGDHCMYRPFRSHICLTIVIAFVLCLHANASNELLGGGMRKLLAELTSSDGSYYNWFGFAAAMNGKTVVVGAPFAHNMAGAAYVFVEPSGGWANMTQTAELTPSDTTKGEEFGLAVAIDGDTIVVGSFAHNAAYVFVKPTSGWKDMTETAILRAKNNGVPDLFGGEVAISGTTIAVGAYQANFDRGRVDVFVRPKGGWTSGYPLGHLTATGLMVNSYLGARLAIRGKTIVAGASGVTEIEGATYVFVKPPGGWKGKHNQRAKLKPSDGSPGNFFGISVAINEDETTVAVGAEGANNNVGAAYVFVEPSGGWGNMTQTAELTASNGQPDDFLGASVAMNTHEVVAGSPTNGGSGAVYSFLQPAGGWANETQSAELTAAGSGDLGSSIAIVGPIILGGARNTKVGSNSLQGAAFIFGP